MEKSNTKYEETIKKIKMVSDKISRKLGWDENRAIEFATLRHYLPESDIFGIAVESERYVPQPIQSKFVEMS